MNILAEVGEQSCSRATRTHLVWGERDLDMARMTFDPDHSGRAVRSV